MKEIALTNYKHSLFHVRIYSKLVIKLVIVALIVVFILFSTTSCIIIPFGENYNLHNESESIIAIDIFYRDYVVDESLYCLIGADEKPVVKIHPDQFALFCDEFEKLDFRRRQYITCAAVEPNLKLSGYIVRITYESCAVEYICPVVQYYYNANEERQPRTNYIVDYEQWKQFINTFANS